MTLPEVLQGVLVRALWLIGPILLVVFVVWLWLIWRNVVRL